MQSVSSNAVYNALSGFSTNAQTYFVQADTSHTFSNLVPTDGKYLVFIEVVFVPYYGQLGNGYFTWTGASGVERALIFTGYASWGYGNSNPIIVENGLSVNVYWDYGTTNSVVYLKVLYKKIL